MSLLKYEGILIFRWPEPTKVKGHYIQGDPTVFLTDANVQPINGDEFLLLPEGNRIKGSLKIYTETPIYDNDVARRDQDKYNVAQSDICTIDNIIDSIDYTCTINSTIFTHTSIIGATALTIASGLVSEINGGSELVTATDNLDGTYTLISDYRGSPYTLETDVNQSFVNSAANITEEYKIMQDKDYSVHSLGHYKAYGFLMGQ